MQPSLGKCYDKHQLDRTNSLMLTRFALIFISNFTKLVFVFWNVCSTDSVVYIGHFRLADSFLFKETS